MTDYLALADEAAAEIIAGVPAALIPRLEQAVRSLSKELADMTDWRNELLQRLNKADLLNDGELEAALGGSDD